MSQCWLSPAQPSPYSGASLTLPFLYPGHSLPPSHLCSVLTSLRPTITSSWPNPDPACTSHVTHSDPATAPMSLTQGSARVHGQCPDLLESLQLSWNFPSTPAVGRTEAPRPACGQQERPEDTEEGSERSKPQKTELEPGRETNRFPGGHGNVWKEGLKQLAGCLVHLGTGLALHPHMSQRPQSSPQSTKPSFLPAAPSNTQNETEVSPITYKSQASIQGSQPTIHNRWVSIQEPPPIINSRRVSIQEPLSIIHNRRISFQDPPLVHSRRTNIQDAPAIINSRWVSTEDMPSTVSSHQPGIQDTSSVTYSHHFSTRDVSPIFETRHFTIQNSPLLPHTSLTNIESIIHSGNQVISQDHLPTNQNPCSSTQCLKSQVRAKVDVPPSITHSPTASIKSVDSVIWTSHETFRDSLDSFLSNPSILDNIQSIQSNRSAEMDSGR